MNVFIGQMCERKRNMRILNGLEEFFCLRSNLSNNGIISAKRPCLKTGMDFRDLKTGVENDIFWASIGSGFEELGGTPPPRIPRGPPRVSQIILSREFFPVL